MNVFITGSTGFLGGEVLVLLSKRKEVDKIFCLVRAKSKDAALVRLEKVFKLHGDHFDKERIIPVLGNLGDAGLSDLLIHNRELHQVNVIIHSAANTSFAKIYDDVVEKVNILGLNEIIWWAKTLKKLQTFMYVGTATIVGKGAAHRVIHEDESPNLKSTHFVKYTYTKMLGEIILRENLPEEKILIVRPSIIMADSRGIVPRSYVIMWALAAGNMMRLVPVNPKSPLDIIPVDYCARAMVNLLFCQRKHLVYHISSGEKHATDTEALTNAIQRLFPERPSFCFVNRKMIGQMKHWARNRMPADSELNKYQNYLAYWEEIFTDKSQLRILFSGLEPYLEFIDLGQTYDNHRLLEDTGMENSEPAHEYLTRCADFIRNIDVLEGALDP